MPRTDEEALHMYAAYQRGGSTSTSSQTETESGGISIALAGGEIAENSESYA